MIVNKYLVCYKEGFKTMKAHDSTAESSYCKGVRRCPSIRTGCLAGVRIKLTPDRKQYVIYNFKEEHNHSFVHESDRHLLPTRRGLPFTHEKAVHALNAINVGPVKAFNIMRTLYGGFDKVGATKNDFKNFKRDLNLYVSEYDADMLIKRLKRKQEYLPNFSFEYMTDDQGVLRCAFWADEIMKRSFYTFGDVISFDATYRRNK